MALKPPVNEIDLLARISKGEQTAFAEIFYAYHNQLGEFVLGITRSSELTEEIIQDVFVKIWSNRAKIIEIDSFKSYLFILTRNYTLNAVRKLVNEHRRQDEYLAQLSYSDLGNTENNYLELIENAVSLLPPQQQKVYLLRQQGLKSAAIAQKMNLSPTSVKKYQQWAILAISKFLKAKAVILFLASIAFC